MIKTCNKCGTKFRELTVKSCPSCYPFKILTKRFQERVNEINEFRREFVEMKEEKFKRNYHDATSMNGQRVITDKTLSNFK